MWYKLDLSYDTKRWRGMQGDTKAGMKKIVSGLYQDCIIAFLFNIQYVIFLLFALIQRYKPNERNIIKLALMFYCECRISSP